MSGSLKIMYVFLLSLFLFACVAPPGTESTGEFLDSATITTKVKATLLNELGAAGFSVQIKTFKDQVQLSGFVPTERLKQRAAAVVRNIEGVRSVINDIVVRS